MHIHTLRVFLWAGLLGQANGQIKILGPDTLLPEFQNSSGFIYGSTSTFGAPSHGDRVMGHLVYAKSKGGSYCANEDYELTPPSNLRSNRQLLSIALVRRGGCSIATQVAIAQAKNAQAVIVVDEETSEFTSEQIQRMIVPDDGSVGQVTIPSIFISRFEGQKLIDAASQGAVVVELSWDAAPLGFGGQVAVADFWMSSGSREAAEFLARFQDSAEVMQRHLEFVPHFHIFSLPAAIGSVNLCAPAIDACDTCTFAVGRYCAPDPDGTGPLTGADVVNEDLRRLCVWNATAQEKSDARYSQAFWDYTEQFSKDCTLNVTNETANETRFGYICSKAVMEKVGIPVDQVNQCINQSFAELLEEQISGVAWSKQALRLNGWRYTGPLDPKQVLEAVCSSFAQKPKECKDLLEVATMSVKAVVRRAKGRGLGSVLAIAGVVIAVLSIAISAYRRHVTTAMRKTLREEVLLEVQAQIADYVSMEDPMGDKSPAKA